MVAVEGHALDLHRLAVLLDDEVLLVETDDHRAVRLGDQDIERDLLALRLRFRPRQVGGQAQPRQRQGRLPAGWKHPILLSEDLGQSLLQQRSGHSLKSWGRGRNAAGAVSPEDDDPQGVSSGGDEGLRFALPSPHARLRRRPTGGGGGGEALGVAGGPRAAGARAVRDRAACRDRGASDRSGGARAGTSGRAALPPRRGAVDAALGGRWPPHPDNRRPVARLVAKRRLAALLAGEGDRSGPARARRARGARSSGDDLGHGARGVCLLWALSGDLPGGGASAGWTGPYGRHRRRWGSAGPRRACGRAGIRSRGP
jgi:hypothetical protein